MKFKKYPSGTIVGNPYFWGILGLLLILVIPLFGPFYSTSFRIDPDMASKFGDFIGGYIGTIFLLMSIVLLVATLRLQYISFFLQQFENTLFTNIKIHIENVNEMELGTNKGLTGRKVFVYILREYQSSLQVLLEALNHLNISDIDENSKRTIAFNAMYYGAIGARSTTMFKQSLSSQSGLSSHADFICNWYTGKKSLMKKEYYLSYEPFEGHLSHLPHYYRHLFNTIAFIDENKDKLDAKKYIKTLKAQLSIHELALLKLFITTTQGDYWGNGKDIDYIKNYSILEDIPKGFWEETTSMYQVSPKHEKSKCL